jgi:hypothetical protein
MQTSELKRKRLNVVGFNRFGCCRGNEHYEPGSIVVFFPRQKPIDPFNCPECFSGRRDALQFLRQAHASRIGITNCILFTSQVGAMLDIRVFDYVCITKNEIPKTHATSVFPDSSPRRFTSRDFNLWPFSNVRGFGEAHLERLQVLFQTEINIYI